MWTVASAETGRSSLAALLLLCRMRISSSGQALVLIPAGPVVQHDWSGGGGSDGATVRVCFPPLLLPGGKEDGGEVGEEDLRKEGSLKGLVGSLMVVRKGNGLRWMVVS